MSRWFRMYDDLIHDTKVLRLSDGLFKAWVTLLCIASKNGGQLPPIDDIALMLRTKPARIVAWLTDLTEHGLLDNNDGIFSPHNWDTRQYKSDSSTERVKRFREKRRNVSSDVSETVPDTETDADAETDTRPQARPVREPSRFEEFWRAYPRRSGANPRAPAEKKFDALVKSGLAPEFLIAEVKKFAALDDTRKNIGTPYVPQAITWLNQQRWSDHATTLADEPLLSQEATLDAAVASFARFGLWSRHAPGNAPGSPGCLASVELLAKHGLGPDGRKLQQPPEAA